MKNEVMDALLSLKQKELDTLRNVAEKYAPNSLYAYEKISNFERPEFKIESEGFLKRLDSYKVKLLVDEPLNSEMKELFKAGDGEISDQERSYNLFKRSNKSSSFDLIGHFFPEEYGIRTVQEVLCTAVYVMERYLMGLPSVANTILSGGQENLDLGLVILKRPMIKGVYEPEVAYNVHLEFKRGQNGEVEEIHLHIFEFPRSFKENRYCLI
jgi:hypothetical protein